MLLLHEFRQTFFIVPRIQTAFQSGKSTSWNVASTTNYRLISMLIFPVSAVIGVVGALVETNIFHCALGNLKIALRGGLIWTPAEGGGGGLEKWGSVSGPLFSVRTDVGAKGTGTQNLARKSFFHQ